METNKLELELEHHVLAHVAILAKSRLRDVSVRKRAQRKLMHSNINQLAWL